MDISEIKDEKTLEAWLQGRSREDAVAIAARAALRVLPPYWLWGISKYSRERGVTALPVLRSNLIAWVSAKCLTAEIKLAAQTIAQNHTDTRNAAVDAAKFAIATVAVEANTSEYVAYAASEAVSRAFSRTSEIWRETQADCRLLEKKEEISFFPIWSKKNPFERNWRDLRSELDNSENNSKSWRFWRKWYATILDPISHPPDWELYEQVALIEDGVWKDGPEAIAKRIAEIEAARQTKANPAERLAAQRLLQAALSDFSFDQAARLMRMVPFADDVKFIRDPEKLARYLAAAEELRDDIETYSAALKAEGTAMQGAAYVATYLDRLLEEFSKTRQTEELNVGKIVKLGKTLDAARLDEVTCREFGQMRMQGLAEIVDQLSDMTRQHFSETLLRFAPLEELELEAETSAWEYLNEMRQAVKGFEVGQGGIPLNDADLAVLRDLADDAERAMRGLDSASGPAKSSFRKEVNYRLAVLTVTVALGKTRVKEVTGPAFKGVDEILKGMKRAKGLSELWELLQKIWE